MKPMLPTSTQWTPFPEDLTREIQQVFENQFKTTNMHRVIMIEGRIYAEEILLRAGYNIGAMLTQHNFELASLYSDKKQVDKKIKKLIDSAASVMNEHIDAELSRDEDESNPMDLPRSWKSIGGDIWFQYSTVNTLLEAEADRLLNIDQSNLVKDDASHEEPLNSAVYINDEDLLAEVNKKFGKQKSSETENTNDSLIH